MYGEALGREGVGAITQLRERYRGKVALKSQHCLAVEVPGKPPYPRKRIAQKREVSKRSSIGMRHTATGTR